MKKCQQTPEKTIHPFNKVLRYPVEILTWVDITEHCRQSPYSHPSNIVFVQIGVVVGEFESKGKKILRIMHSWEISPEGENSEYFDIPVDTILKRKLMGYVEVNDYEDFVFKASTNNKDSN